METYVDGDEDIQPFTFSVCVLVYVEFFCGIVSHNYGILGKFLVETFWRCAFDVEVEGLNGDEEAAEWQEGKEGTHLGQCADTTASGVIAKGGPRILMFLPRSRYPFWEIA